MKTFNAMNLYISRVKVVVVNHNVSKRNLENQASVTRNQLPCLMLTTTNVDFCMDVLYIMWKKTLNNLNPLSKNIQSKSSCEKTTEPNFSYHILKRQCLCNFNLETFKYLL